MVADEGFVLLHVGYQGQVRESLYTHHPPLRVRDCVDRADLQIRVLESKFLQDQLVV